MHNYIDYNVLDKILFRLKEFICTSKKEYLEDIQEDLKLAREIDYSIKTKAEYAKQQEFIATSHGPKRLAMFLLSYFGEFYLAESLITIDDDDPIPGYASHTNTYRLKLKDPETHTRLYKGNPTKDDEPYDFYTEFVKQISKFKTNIADTTDSPWDSYQHAYVNPYRKLDFKGAFWQAGNEHYTHYILQLQRSKDLVCYKSGTKITKEIKVTPTPEASGYLNRYFEVLDLIDFFSKYWYLTWESFILNSD